MELLSPAGNYRSAIASFNAGSDAIYLGGKLFSARMNADNFSDDEIVQIIQYAHRIGRKVYVTMNTLIFQDEFVKAVNFARFLYNNHVDGVIIQDLGLAHYLHKTMPNLILHASTQLNCHNLQQAIALKKIGFKRVVLARESDIKLIKEVKSIGLEVEVFVHGALCVSYSGNCLMSSFIGGRSGNRGRCAQPCRMQYQFIENDKEIGYKNYAISTKDLMTLEQVGTLIDLKVDSLKIEGRLKQNEYVYAVTNAYRHAIDACFKNNQNNFLKEDKSNLTKIFSRKFTKGYLFDESPFKLLNQESSSHQGERIGKVIKTSKSSVFIRLYDDVHRLDGIRFNDKRQYGMQIGKMFVQQKDKDIAHKNEIIEIRNIDGAMSFLNVEVIRTTNYLLEKDINLKMKENIVLPFKGKLICYINKPLSLELKVKNKRLSIKGDIVLKAEKNGTSYQRIKEQLSKSGEYPYSINEINIIGDDNIFIPISSLNKLRNEAYEKIAKEFEESYQIIEENYFSNLNLHHKKFNSFILSDKKDSLYNEYPFEQYLLNNNEYSLMNRINKNLILNGNTNMIHHIFINESEKDCIASCYCNITNSYALDCYYELGFKECVLSLELDYASIKLLIDDFYKRHNELPPVGIYVYGKIDLMIMKSCPIGTLFNFSKSHCLSCETNKYKLRDRMNVDFPLIRDNNCNMRLLNSFPIYLIDYLNEFKDLGIQSCYLNFTNENEDDKRIILNNYCENIVNKKSIMSNKFTRGHFNKRVE